MRRFSPHPTSASPISIASAVIALLTFCAVAGAALLPNDRAAVVIVNAAAISDSPTTVGISDNDMFFTATDPAAIARRLDALQSLGVKNIRLAIPWATVEPSAGQFDWTAIDNMVNAAAARGLGVLGVVNTTPPWARGTYTNVYAPPTDPSTFGTFSAALASRYAGKISAYEVWNEPNSVLSYQPGPDPAGYTALLKAAYTAIKGVDPQAQVIGAVVGSTLTWGSWTLNPVDFVQQMYAAGAKGYFDALSFHPYQYTLPLSQGALVPNSPLDQANRIFQLMQTFGDGTKKIWSSEYGVPTGVPNVGNQASLLNDFLTTWSNLSYAGPTFIYSLVDRNSADTTDAESTFGLFTDSWVAKAAAQVVKTFIASHPQSVPAAAPPANPLAAWAAAVQAAVRAWLQQVANSVAAALNPSAGTAQRATTSTTPSTTTSTTSSASSSSVASSSAVSSSAASSSAVSSSASSSSASSSSAASSSAQSSAAPLVASSSAGATSSVPTTSSPAPTTASAATTTTSPAPTSTSSAPTSRSVVTTPPTVTVPSTATTSAPSTGTSAPTTAQKTPATSAAN